MVGDISGDVVATVFAELDRLLLAKKPATLGVAVSGGGDSTALLFLAVRWARARGYAITAATIDHGLRADSAAEAAAVAALCARLGVAHETLRTGNLREAGGNLSAAARDARIALVDIEGTGVEVVLDAVAVSVPLALGEGL